MIDIRIIVEDVAQTGEPVKASHTAKPHKRFSFGKKKEKKKGLPQNSIWSAIMSVEGLLKTFFNTWKDKRISKLEKENIELRRQMEAFKQAFMENDKNWAVKTGATCCFYDVKKQD
ncbi:hypothetical protein OS493_026287 [Desmophyllum pertusum]|uniref:Uncharacterized protein n=1 Tax=Desmophyllum pertusum TaxID=174260 RepID=A0A9X0D222_9CNID|nr:hypothetical protein OS493_026287 [Desmophyllum pertusum]